MFNQVSMQYWEVMLKLGYFEFKAGLTATSLQQGVPKKSQFRGTIKALNWVLIRYHFKQVVEEHKSMISNLFAHRTFAGQFNNVFNIHRPAVGVSNPDTVSSKCRAQITGGICNVLLLHGILFFPFCKKPKL